MTGIIGKTSRSGIVESAYNGIISSATEPYAASANLGKLWFDTRLEIIRVSDGAK